ncbi:hypothetical protein POM88_054002 [Heracleum sosnowskyi]|uniref:F-box associated beta-propeller type 3 domain-containing protein n=1 Tax=Heracleum sosnowskyi TaxID=360622 RepID=A0AAD8GP84_9APIA|nr:hypothetical protein POM88_054002 [Heracleum sosnowskyi]
MVLCLDQLQTKKPTSLATQTYSHQLALNCSNFCYLVRVGFPESNVHMRDKGDKQRVVLGFGFDVIGDDFKVVKLVSDYEVFSAEVYSVRRYVWQNVEPSPNDFPTCVTYDVEGEKFDVYGKNFDVCVNGFLCTIGMYGMIAFDLNAEVFDSGIKLPVTEFDSFYHSARITEYNDSIAAIILMSSDGHDGNINLWALDDEVVELKHHGL